MLLSLANELKVLPTDLNRLLIIVVVLSMALTPFLAEAGKRFADSTVEGDSGGELLAVQRLTDCPLGNSQPKGGQKRLPQHNADVLEN